MEGERRVKGEGEMKGKVKVKVKVKVMSMKILSWKMGWMLNLVRARRMM